MRVLFLDFDGVLKLWPNINMSKVFDKQACINLEMLLSKVPDLKIVVSSAWRVDGLESVTEVLKSNGIDPRRVLDITGHEQSGHDSDHRGFQIECWLKVHPAVKQFVILDDESDMGQLKTKLVKTDRYTGLTQANVEKALKILEEK